MKKILVTGPKSFIGKNLCCALEREKFGVIRADVETRPPELEAGLFESSMIIHLAEVSRPEDQKDFLKVNYQFTVALIAQLKRMEKKVPVIFPSTALVELEDPFGRSKKMAEGALSLFARETGSPLYLYRFSNVFGKWDRPQDNSFVASLCHNIAHDFEVTFKPADESKQLELVYIDDVVREFLRRVRQQDHGTQESYFYSIPEKYSITTGEFVKKLLLFKSCVRTSGVPNLALPFDKKLFSTFISYLQPLRLAVKLRVKSDERGRLFEFLKSRQAGQIFVSVMKPGVIRGNHYHDTKIEKFCLISGEALIRIRKIGTTSINEFSISEKHIEVVHIPPGHAHSITNTGDSDATVLLWANEILDPEKPDTYPESVTLSP